MKLLLFFALLGCVVANVSASDLAHKQQGINRLLCKVTEPIRAEFSDLKQAADHFNPASDGSLYSDYGKAAKELSLEIEDDRTLEQHHYFSLFNNRHRQEALMFFDVLRHAKSWSTFINSAAYYRELLNEGVFVYGLYVAVIHSDVGHGIVLPPLYEVTPHMFANTEIIQKAYSAKMSQISGRFNMSFTGSQKNPEQRVAYFGEDIGLNVHHVTWHMDYPFWWKDSYGHHIDRKGELFFWVHHQLTARFDSERLSNNLNIVDELYWDRPIYEGFVPHTTYKYGGEFPSRPDNVHFQDVDGVAKIRDMKIYDSRIRDAIAHGYITAKDGSAISIRGNDGIGIIGDVIESSEYSPNVEYYGALHNFAHIILGRQGDPKGKFAKPPGVMEHFETATRDPAFFRLHKYMDNLFKDHQDSLKPYTPEDINFSGVSINSVGIDGKLETFFEDFEFDLDNSVDETVEDYNATLIAVVSRLNHEPFSYKIDATNNNNQEVLTTVRIYLCPLKDANGILYTYETGRWQCIEMDKFWKKLKPGNNLIIRSSKDSSITVPDTPGFAELMSKTDAAIKSGSALDLHDFARSCGIPNRLLLPKGKTEGMDFNVFVALTDGSKDAAISGLEKSEHGGSHGQCGIQGGKYPDKQPLGYPLDRHISDKRVFLQSPNIKYQPVKVYNRK